MVVIYKTKKEAIAACKAGGYVGKTLPEEEEQGFFCVKKDEIEQEWITEEYCKTKGGSVADAVACADGNVESAAKLCIFPSKSCEEKGKRAIFIKER